MARGRHCALDVVRKFDGAGAGWMVKCQGRLSDIPT